MANWLTKTLNKVGSSITGDSGFNIWHGINQVGSGVAGFAEGSIKSIPNALAGAAAGAAAGGIPGAIVGAVVGGAPVVAQGVVNSVNDYNGSHGYDVNTSVSKVVNGIAGATNLVGGVASAVAGVTKNEKVAGVANAVAGVAGAVGSVAQGVGTVCDTPTAAPSSPSSGEAVQGPVSHAGGGASTTVASGASPAAVSGSCKGWKKTYIPVTERWEKTAPVKKGKK